MADEKLLTVREAAQLLGVSEKDILTLEQEKAISAHKVGGVYLRFKREELLEFRKTSRHRLPAADTPVIDSPLDKIRDFFYLNDFYIAAILIIAILLFVIFKGY